MLHNGDLDVLYIFLACMLKVLCCCSYSAWSHLGISVIYLDVLLSRVDKSAQYPCHG